MRPNFDLSNIDVKKGVKIPDKITPELAYLCGVIVGDGHLSHRENKKDYALKCVGHKTDEKEFYDVVLVPLFKKVFGISLEPKLRDGGTTYGIEFHSKSVVRFLSEYIGIPIGAKSGIVQIPEIFKEDELLIKSFIRGYADTDFCLTLKKRYRDIQYYPVIIGASNSRIIMEEVSEYLESLGFVVSRDFDRPVYDERFGKEITVHRFQLYGHRQLVLWMKTIGFSSPKHLRKFMLWKERNVAHSREKIRETAQLAGVGFEFVSGVPSGKPLPTTFGL